MNPKDKQPDEPAQSALQLLEKPFATVPFYLKPFAGKTPAELLQKYLPSVNLEAAAGILSGFVDMGIPLPPWVKNASWQFWKHYLGNKPLNLGDSAEDFGVFVKLLEVAVEGHMHIITPLEPPAKMEKWMAKILKMFVRFLVQKIIPKFSDEEKSQYYAGRVRGEQVIGLLRDPAYLDMAKRAKIYAMISCAWRKMEALPNHAERERWLRSEKVIGENVSLREVYEIFQVIGLPGAAPGRPKIEKSVPPLQEAS